MEAILESRHRLDFGLVFIDAVNDKILAGSLAYTYSLTPRTQFSASFSYLDSSFGLEGGAGIGDSALTFSWAPGVDISAGPWVPQQVGTGISVILPTGSVSKGHSSGTTIVQPFLGLVLPMSDSWYLFPSLSYMYSLEETAGGTDVNLGLVDLGVRWVSERGFWWGAYAALARDLEVNETFYNYALDFGLTISDRWGASIEYDHTDYFLPGAVSGLAAGVDIPVDRQISLNAHFNF